MSLTIHTTTAFQMTQTIKSFIPKDKLKKKKKEIDIYNEDFCLPRFSWVGELTS